MNNARRKFIRNATLGVTGLALGSRLSGSAEAGDGAPGRTDRQRPPNLVYIFADQLNYQSCGFSGETRAHTPNLDRMAAAGINMSEAVSCCPLCAPHRNSLFTGKYPSATHYFRNDLRARPDPDAIGHVLQQGGYQTGYIGKWHLYGRNSAEKFTPPGPYRLGFDQYFAAYGWNHDYWNGYYYLDDETRHTMPGYQDTYQTDMAIKFMERKQDQPFALFLSWETPHPPCTEKDVPAEYYDLFRNTDFSDLLYAEDNVFRDFDPAFDKEWQKKNVIDVHAERCRTYYAMTACLDANLGRIMASLDRLNLTDNTIVVFSSDHGDMLGGLGRIEKRIFFEQSARVPFLIQWKGGLASGRKLTDCFNTPDIAPTLLELMSLPRPASYQGRSWASRMRGEAMAAAPEHAYLTLMHGGLFNRHEEYRALRSQRHLYARMVRTGKEFLFDHQRDPRQESNLAGTASSEALLQNFRHALDTRMSELGDEFHTQDWHEANWVRDGCLV